MIARYFVDISFSLEKHLYENYKDVLFAAIDNMNGYYDAQLKDARFVEPSEHPSFIFMKTHIADKEFC